MFLLGCPNVIVVTDHEPLKRPFGDQNLSTIHKPHLFRLKEKSMRYRFTMQHYPGKWHRAPDAISRNPVTTVQSLLDTFHIEPSPIDTDESDEICAATRLTALTCVSILDGHPAITSLDHIRIAGQKDAQYTLLGKTIDNGFPNSRQATLPSIPEYWEVRNRLSNDNGLIQRDWRIVIPNRQRKNKLKSLHSAHQRVVGMKTLANESVYWPGMNASIRNYRDNCITCSRNAPSLPHEPIEMTATPEWPFQQIVMDLFHAGSFTYLTCADRLIGWLILYRIKLGQTVASRLISICRKIFQTYGMPEELSSDGGPPFSAYSFKQFLKYWAVK